MSTKHTHIACNLMFIMSYCRMFSLHTLPMSIYYECNTLSPHIKFCSTHFEASQRLMIDFVFDIFWTDFRPSDGKIGDLMLENRSPKMSKIFLHLRSKKFCSSFFFEQRIDPHRFCATCGSATEHLLPAICDPLFKFPLFGPIVDPDPDIFLG